MPSNHVLRLSYISWFVVYYKTSKGSPDSLVPQGLLSVMADVQVTLVRMPDSVHQRALITKEVR